MATITTIGGNLNTYGNNGHFEADRSTWGFGDPTDKVISRSSIRKYAGTYAAMVRHGSASTSSPSTGVKCSFTVPNGSVGKKYLLRAKVYVPDIDDGLLLMRPIASDEQEISLSANSFDDAYHSLDPEFFVAKTVAEAKNTWLEISAVVDILQDFLLSRAFFLQVTGMHAEDGYIFVDEFEVFEVTIEEDPEPTCTIDLDEENTIVTDESAPGAADGSIEGAVTGGTGPFEWSLNAGAWQSSNLFAGLGSGNHTLSVREQADTDCSDSHVFAINSAPVAFDFTIAITHETISGASDGSAILTPSGGGSAPYTYSKDGGATFQAGNSFSDLPPGTYPFVVKDSTGTTLVKYGTVNAGAVDIEKVWHSKNHITRVMIATAGWQGITNYRLYNDVRVEDEFGSGVFNSKLKVDLHPDASGKATFYIREAFRDAFQIEPPAVNESSILKLTDRIKRFKVFSGSVQDQEVTPVILAESLPSLVLWGGVSKEAFPSLNFFTSYLATNKKFLTWAPAQKYVDRTQEDYLNFFVYGFFSSLKLRIKAYFDDDTTATETVQTVTGVKHYDLYRIPAGPVNSGATTVDPTKTLIKYDLSLLDETDGVISEVRTYHVVPYRHPLTRHFMFLNSLGGEEVLRFTGQAIETTAFQRELLQRFLPHDYDALDGEFKNNVVVSKKLNSYSSGFMKGRLASQWHAYMEDFLLSPRVYLVTDGQRLPVVITGGELTREDQNNERFIRFEARPAFDNVSFTPDTQ